MKSKESEPGAFMYSEIQEQPKLLENLLHQNSFMISEIIGRLREKEIVNIQIVARGTSHHVAIFGKYLGEYYLGIPVNLMASSIINLYRRPINLANSLTIGISQSGAAPDVIGVIAEAKSQGGLTLAITNEEGSPLSQETDYSLYCQAGKEKSVPATKTFTTSMMLLATLIGEWSSSHSLMETQKSVPPIMAEVISREDEIERYIREMKEAEEILVLGRGFNYPSALETALKIKETCQIHANGYSTADFLHGPIAKVKEGMPIIIYAFQGPLLKGISKTITQLREMGADIILVTDEESLIGDKTFYTAKRLREEVTPFISGVFGQLFSYYFSKAKGYNPDNPPYLNKVTRTV